MVKNIYSQKCFKLKLKHYNNSTYSPKTSNTCMYHLIFPSKSQTPTISLRYSCLKVIITYNISTSLIFLKSSQSFHHSLIHFHKIITTNHVNISFVSLNHGLSHPFEKNHANQCMVTSSILHLKAKQPNKTKNKTDEAKNNRKIKTIHQQQR